MLDTTTATVNVLQAIAAKYSNGDPWDYAGQYGEPGYDASLVVLGNYWCRCEANDGQLHDIVGYHYPAIQARLEEDDVQLEWCDEWMVDYDNDKAYRTTGDSYGWQPSAIITDDGELLTPDDDVEEWIAWAQNTPTRAIPSYVYGAQTLQDAGFVRHNGTYENGFHPGQDDDPKAIAAAIEQAHGPYADIVFLINSNGQFDTRFSAYYRPDDDVPLDVWLRIPTDSEEAEAEANTYQDDGRYRVDWSLTAVGLIKSRTFDTHDQARAWLTSEGFADYTA